MTADPNADYYAMHFYARAYKLRHPREGPRRANTSPPRNEQVEIHLDCSPRRSDGCHGARSRRVRLNCQPSWSAREPIQYEIPIHYVGTGG